MYVKDLNKLGHDTIQQALHVLNPDGGTVKWTGFLSAPTPMSKSTLAKPEEISQMLELGHYYLLQGQVRPQHSHATSGSFDAEKWALQQNIMAGFRIKTIQELQPQQLYALGYGKYLAHKQSLHQRFLLWVEKKRLALRVFIRMQSVQHKGLLLALLTGDEKLIRPKHRTAISTFRYEPFIGYFRAACTDLCFYGVWCFAICDFTVYATALSSMATAVFFKPAFSALCFDLLCLCRI